MKKIMTAILVGFTLFATASVFADSNTVTPPIQFNPNSGDKGIDVVQDYLDGELYNWVLPVTQQVNTNTTSISTNAGNITALQMQQKTNTSNIGTLQTQQKTNTTNIGTIQTQQKTNTSNIGTNTTNIGTLQTQQQTNMTNIDTLQNKQKTNITAIGSLQGYFNTLFTNATPNQTIQQYMDTEITNGLTSNGVIQKSINAAINVLTDKTGSITALQTQQQINITNIGTLQNKQKTNTDNIGTLQSQLSALTGPNGTIQTSINNATQPLQTNFSTLFGSVTPTQSISDVIASNLNVPVPTSSDTNLQNAISTVITNALSSTNSTPAAANLQTAVQTVAQASMQAHNGVWYVNNPANLQSVLNSAGAVALLSNPQTVKLALGPYPLSSSLNIPSYVTLQGEGKLATQLIANNASSSFYPIVMNPDSGLENLSVVNTNSAPNLQNAVGLNCTSSNINNFTLSRVFIQINGNQGYGNALQFFDSNLPPNESTQAAVNLNIDSSDFYAYYFLNNAPSVLAPLSNGSSISLLDNKILQVGADTRYNGCQIMFRNPPGLFVQNSTHYIIGNAGQNGTGSGESWMSCGPS